MLKTHYSIQQLAHLSGVSRRTLHYYDEIGLLVPESIGGNGYRYYGEVSIFRLQQILLYRELEFPLAEIKRILDHPGFNVIAAMRSHRVALQKRQIRIGELIDTIDRTIEHLQGVIPMDDKDLYIGFDEQVQKEYAAEARERYGAEIVDESYRRLNRLSREQQKEVFAEGGRIFSAIRDAMPQGYDSPIIQGQIQALKDYIGFFYECTVEILRGLGQMYNSDPRFIKMYQTQYHPDMPAFLERAITYYCDHHPE